MCNIINVKFASLFISFVCLCVCNSISGDAKNKAQDSVYIGTATLNDGGMFTYKLQFFDSSGIIKGFSVMDINGAGETKASISGTMNASKTQIFFKELDIITSKGKTDSSEFCIMQGSLKVKNYKGTRILKGHFEGYLNGGKTVCAYGKLVLISPKDAFKILGKNEENADSIIDAKLASKKKQGKELFNPAKGNSNNAVDSSPIKIKDTVLQITKLVEKKEPKTNPIVTFESAPKNVLRVQPGKTIELNCSTSIQTLEVWDNKDIDGDIITLMQGGKALIKNYTLTGTHYEVNVDIGKKQTDTLRLIAISEGTEPLNTSRIKITSGNDFYFIDATTTIDKDVLIVLKRK